MLNKTYVVNKKSTSLNIDAKNERLSIKKTDQKSKIAHVRIDSDAFKLMMGEEPFLIDETNIVYGEPFPNPRCDVLYPFLRETKEYYTHGITVLQIQQNGEYAFVEYIDRECEPKLKCTKFEEITIREKERLTNG